MKNAFYALICSAFIMTAVTSCQKSQDILPKSSSVDMGVAPAINDSAIIDTGVCAMLHGLASQQNINFNNYPSIQTTVWTYSGTPAPRRSIFKFDFTHLNPNCTNTSLVSAKLYLYQYDELGGSGNYYSIAQVANDAEVRRVKVAWNPTTVTWANQPATYPGLPTNPQNAVAISPIATPFTGSNDNQVIDVTAIVKKMLQGGAPYPNNFGFELRFPNGRETQAYKARTYGSFASPLTSVRPVLKLYWQ